VARHLLVVASLLSVGCGSSTPAASTVADAGDAAPAMTGHSARGSVVDLSGNPVVNIYVTVSTEFCIPDRTSPSGTFTVRNVAPGPGKRLILYGPTAKNGPYASLSFAFSGADDVDYDFARPIVTPKLEAPLAYKSDVAEPQKLTTPDGFAITLRSADLHIEGFGDAKLYAVPVPLDKAPPFAALSRLHVLYVLEPLQSTIASPAAVEFPNPKGLAVGAKVDILQLDYAKGELLVRGTGRVRADGKVASDDGSGITELTWVGFAPSGS
jgi:hypothetical protein